MIWPTSLALARAYLAQRERNGGLSACRISEIRSASSAAERGGCGNRNTALAALVPLAHAAVSGALDKRRVESRCHGHCCTRLGRMRSG